MIFLFLMPLPLAALFAAMIISRAMISAGVGGKGVRCKAPRAKMPAAAAAAEDTTSKCVCACGVRQQSVGAVGK